MKESNKRTLFEKVNIQAANSVAQIDDSDCGLRTSKITLVLPSML